MRFQIVQPNGFLKYFIKDYCFMESSEHDEEITERVIPTENIQLMFHYKNPFVVHHTHEIKTKQPYSILSGLNDSYSDVSTHGETGVVFISFFPAGACHFFRFPLSEIENQSVDVFDVLGYEIRQVEESLYLAKTVREKIFIIEKFFTERYSPIPSHDNLLIRKGVETIKSYKGQIRADSLSDCLSTTSKTLERKFSNYLGKTTKQVIKLIRFQEVLHDFSINKDMMLIDLAYKNGYFDQSHFIRDFKTFSGYTPKEFAAKYPDFTF
jgi:AraC-like DNA-binding protein